MFMPEEKKADKKIDYNKRADGYGSAGAENQNVEQHYEKEREKEKHEEASTKDEHGQSNQQGEVDQYTFRE